MSAPFADGSGANASIGGPTRKAIELHAAISGYRSGRIALNWLCWPLTYGRASTQVYLTGNGREELATR